MLNEFRQAFRSLTRNWGFTLIAIVVMGLGIAAVTYAFGGYYGFSLRPLPYTDADELVHVEHESDKLPRGYEVDDRDYLDIAERQQSFKETFASAAGTVNLSGDGDRPERFEGAFVTSNALTSLGVEPLLGRSFVAGEDAPGAPLVAVLGWNVWQHRYGGDPEILGKSVRLNGEAATIVGVMPRGFAWPAREDLWLPLRVDPGKPRGDLFTVEVYGRLKPGVTLEQARGDMTRVYESILTDNPGWNTGARMVTQKYRDEWVGVETRAVLSSMLIATGLVLLIACANVANLFLARSAVRRRELAIRVSLGASRGRLALGMLAESLIIAAAAGALGYALSSMASDATDQWINAQLWGPPTWVRFEQNWATMSFAVLVTFVTAGLAALLPAIRIGKGDVTENLKASGAGGLGVSLGRLTRTLVIVEIALSCALLIGGGLTVRSLVQLQYTDVGADLSNVMTARVGLFEADYPAAEDRRRFWQSLEREAGNIAGAESVAVTSSLPGTFSGMLTYQGDRQVPGPEGQLPSAQHVVASPEFFDVFRIPVLNGRGFTEADRSDTQPVAVINEQLAELAFPGMDPVGRSLRVGETDDQEAVTVVGIVPDVFHRGFREGPVSPAIYRPLAQDDARFMSLAVRTARQPEALANNLAEAVLQVDPDLPVYWLEPAEHWLEVQAGDFRLISMIFGTFGVMAVLLAAVGVYGVLAFSVAQRTREFGVRRALGCEERGILKLVMGQGARQLLIALPVGIALASVIGFGLQSVLVGVGALDPATYAGVPMLLLAIVFAASFIPALRATRVHPMEALRYE
jgi:predicted permease